MIRWDRTQGRPEPIRALNRVAERESGEPLVLLQDHAPSVRLARPQVIPYVRLEVARKAEAAAQALPEGIFLGVTDAWRPIARQKRIYDWLTRCALEVWPNLSYAALRRKINRWAAPYDQPAPPGHCTGAAIDVNLLDSAGEVIDVWSPFDRFVAAPTYSYGLDPEPLRFRMILVEAMLGAGFSNCRDEGWHYSYGDAGWAVRMGLNECCYGLVELQEELFAEQERLWIEAFAQRPNPFLPPSPG